MSSQRQAFREREEAVQAITERDRLLEQIAAAERDLESLQEGLRVAIARDDGREAARLSRATKERERSLRQMYVALSARRETIEDLKAQMRMEEESVRRRVQQALWRREQWKSDQRSGSLPPLGPGAGLGSEPGRMMRFVGATLLLLGILMGLYLCLTR